MLVSRVHMGREKRTAVERCSGRIHIPSVAATEVAVTEKVFRPLGGRLVYAKTCDNEHETAVPAQARRAPKIRERPRGQISAHRRHSLVFRRNKDDEHSSASAVCRRLATYI